MTIFNVQTIGDWLKTVEWYDNHSIQTWLDCKRKFYYHKEYESVPGMKGLDAGVGNGARFGGAMHAGLAAYYTAYGQPDPVRRDAAFRAFDKEYTKRFGSVAQEMAMATPNEHGTVQLDSKHRRNRGLVILDEYFDRFEKEDLLWRPVDAELGFIVRLEHPDNLYPPFWYTARIDGLFETVNTGDWFILETKTTGSGAAREAMRLTFNRQPTGYVVGLRRFEDGRRIQGFWANAILIASQKTDFVRAYYSVNKLQEEEWIRETFEIVEEIRLARVAGDVHKFYKNTGHCTAYGKCSFWDLCRMGYATLLQTPQATREFRPTTWHPFMTSEEDQ